MKIRGFEKVSFIENEKIKLPEASTKSSAGYDFFAIEDTVIKPQGHNLVYSFGDEVKYNFVPTLVSTGIKAYMGDGEFLQLCNRSSNPLNKGLILANGVGIIDC